LLNGRFAPGAAIRNQTCEMSAFHPTAEMVDRWGWVSLVPNSRRSSGIAPAVNYRWHYPDR
jgi:hypothetical protein